MNQMFMMVGFTNIVFIEYADKKDMDTGYDFTSDQNDFGFGNSNFDNPPVNAEDFNAVNNTFGADVKTLAFIKLFLDIRITSTT